MANHEQQSKREDRKQNFLAMAGLIGKFGAGAFEPQGIGRGSVAGDSVPFLFHYTATDSFHTTFVYDRATDSWQWHMDNDSSGVRRPFARVTLTRR